MKVWSRVLTLQDVHDAANEVNSDFPGCAVYLAPGLELVVGPRSRRLERVRLRSRFGTRHPNPGTGGRDHDGHLAASWTEWGWFLARVFAKDPEARAGQYRGVEDFNEQTRYRFVEPRTARELQIMRTTGQRLRAA